MDCIVQSQSEYLSEQIASLINESILNATNTACERSVSGDHAGHGGRDGSSKAVIEV